MTVDSIVTTQADSLIRQLREEQERRCREIEREAIAWRRERLREARRQARQKVEAAVRIARERRRREIAAAAAQVEAENRGRRQAQLTNLLAEVMQRVPDELIARWRATQTRRHWIDAAFKDAERRLGASAWTVTHAAGVAREERVAEFGGASLTWIEDPDLQAGLVVVKSGARLDASIGGLLADLTELQSRALQLLGKVLEST